jgi:biopolymer transport protein ExbD
MSLRTRNKRSAQFNMSSLTDIIFLLLIFFLLTSTLVQPNAVKLLLPNSNSKTQATQSMAIAIDAQLKHYVNNKSVRKSELAPELQRLMQLQEPGSDQTAVLYADKSVPVENVVEIINIANDLQLKLILATEPPK